MKLSRLAVFIASLSASFAATSALAPAASASPKIPVPIAIARHLALGTSVTVLGSVTVPSNAFDAGFAIQGALDGLYVLDSAGSDRHIGDLVEVTGVLTDNFGLLSLQPTSVISFGHLPALPARPSSTGAVGEATEGRLLRLHGTMVGDLIDDGAFGNKINIDDGSGPIQIFLFPNVGIPLTGLVAGAKISVSCFSNQFEDIFECDPPAAGDFKLD